MLLSARKLQLNMVLILLIIPLFYMVEAVILKMPLNFLHSKILMVD